MAQLFDVEGARQAGWNDLEIAQYLQSTGRPAADRQQILATRPSAGPASSFADPSLTLPEVSEEAIAGGRGLAKLRAAQAKVPTVNAGPVYGGPISDPSEQFSSLGLGIVPTNKWEAALLGAGLIPGAKIAGAAKLGAGLIPGAEAAIRYGTRAIENAWPEIGRLGGAFAPEPAPVRGNTAAELTAQQQQSLSPEELNRTADLSQQYPAFGQAAPYMTPMELQKTIASGANVEKVNRLLTVLPQAEQLSAVAKFGEPKRGWYRASTQAIMDVFGLQDAPRFASLLASMSPQTSVENNLLNALNTWKNWTAAGRPTDPRQIIAVMGQSVQGTKGEQSVLDAWRNNAVRALSAPNPLETVLSGPKVDSFYRNLADDVYRVTNDAWMASGMGVNQGLFAGSADPQQLLRGDPGLSPGYIGTNARVRQAGQSAGIYPNETQEALWSVYMPLYEQQLKTGLPARALLDRGLITPEVIRGTPDFSTLLKQGEYRNILEQGGYGPQLQAMQEHQWPTSYPSLTLAEQQHVDDVARRLEQLRGNRAMESRAISMSQSENPQTGFAFATPEYVPGAGTRHLEGLIAEPYGVRKNFTGRAAGAFEDLQNKDILHQALGLNPLETRRATGAWTTKKGGLEINPSTAIGQEIALTPEGIPEDVATKLNAAAAARGAMTAQLGEGWNLQKPSEAGTSLFLPAEKKVPPDVMREVANNFLGKLRSGTMAIADTGAGTAILNFKDRLLSKTARDFLADKLGEGNRIATQSFGDYIDYSKEWRRKLGSGEVTRKMFGYVDRLNPTDFDALDQAIRQPAGDLLKLNTTTAASRKEPVRDDLMNLLKITRDTGLVGLKKALDSKAFLPSAIGAALFPLLQSAGQRHQSED